MGYGVHEKVFGLDQDCKISISVHHWQVVNNIRATIWRVCLVTCDINHLDCCKPYTPINKYMAAHAQRPGLQSARSAQRGKHNGTLTLPRFLL